MSIKRISGVGGEGYSPDGLQGFGQQVQGPAFILNQTGNTSVAYRNQEIRIPYGDGTLVLEVSTTPVRDIPRVNLTYHSA